MCAAGGVENTAGILGVMGGYGVKAVQWDRAVGSAGSPAASLTQVSCRQGVRCCEEYRHSGALLSRDHCNMSLDISPIMHGAGYYPLLLLTLPFAP